MQGLHERLRPYRRLLACCLVLWSLAAAAAAPAVPPELEPWRQWVLDGEEFRRCPMLAGSDADDADSFVCAWPERLSLDVTAAGARYAQRWVVYAESWVPLPGDDEHWPRDVTVNGAEAAVVAHEDAPQLHLTPGTYVIAGVFRWTRRPESLAVPGRTALIDLTVDGQRIAQPERPDGAVWLGQRRSAQQQEQMEIQVYRRVQDQVPTLLTTLIRLQVAGEGREELLSRVLPEGFVPLSLQGELPARIEPDGHLRVQVRAGSWEITLAARGPDVASTLRRPKVDGPWAKEEVWSFASDDRLRVVAIEGVGGVDPAQTGVPPDWRTDPAYRMAEGDEMRIVERSRGLSSNDENQLRLNRALWLDFGHGGYTVVDDITGRMRQGWRLDIGQPQRLLSATSRGENLLVTLGANESLTGIELREPNVQIRAVSRIEGEGGLSATGWQARFTGISGTLNLPPGHRLLAVAGADEAPTAWIKRWRLLDMFLVLIAAAAIARVLGWPAGALALVAFVLTRHDADGQVWLWINVVLALVLAREAPMGRLRSIATVYRNLSVAALVIALAPFVFQQARLALHPQLEQESLLGAVAGLAAADRARAVQLEFPAAEPAPAPLETRTAKESFDAESVVVTGSRIEPSPAKVSGLNYAQVLQRYAPGTQVQTGPGVPNWRYNVHSFTWSGPVDQDQSMDFWILTPGWLALWRILGCVLLAALLVLIAHAAFGKPPLPPWAHRHLRATAPVLLLALVPLLALAPLRQARAQAPSPEILKQLKERLTRAPECTPDCGEMMHARVRAAGQELEIVLDVSALAPIAVPIPSAETKWEPQSISIDGQPNGGVYRDSEGKRWVAVRPGAHQVRLTGRIADGDSVPLVFALRPRTVEVSVEGWEFSGVGDGRLLTDTLELVRKRAAAGPARLDAGREFPPFVRVRRHIVLDLDWSISTGVERIAPEKGAFTLAIPLLPTESVLTEGIEVREDRHAVVALPAGATTVSWQSGLPRAESLQLQFPNEAPRTEVWSFAVSPQWHATFNGVPLVLPDDPDAGQWIFEFHPRAGESLAVAVTRPKAAEGATLAIDGVNTTLQVGKRATSGSMRLQYRSTQGGRHTLALPPQARVTAVDVDGRSVAVRPQNGELALGLLPGSHSIGIEWQIDQGVSWRTRAPGVDLRSPASNLATQLQVPRDRWVLFAFGAGVGPAVLFWSELVVFLVLAVLIGRSPRSPLRTQDWLLIGLGLSTFSWAVLVLFAAWMFAMRWREAASAEVGRVRFNVRQAVLGLLSVIALASLVAAIPNGLLGTPDMRIAGPGSAEGSYAWFLDATQGGLPQPGVISVSIWWYRAAMLAWALWLSFALLRWVPWAWRAWSRNGIWRGRIATAGRPSPPPAASATSKP